MPPSSTHDGTPHTSDSATDCFSCDVCGQCKFTCITFVKPAGDGGGLGFDVSRDHTQCLPPAQDDRFYVRCIIAGGLADRDGRLREGIASRYFGILFYFYECFCLFSAHCVCLKWKIWKCRKIVERPGPYWPAVRAAPGDVRCAAVECYRRRQTPATVSSLAPTPYIMCRRASSKFQLFKWKRSHYMVTALFVIDYKWLCPLFITCRRRDRTREWD